MIKLVNESAADKDLYDDLYSYADKYRMTSRWTKDNVEKYLKRQKDFRRMSDADFDKVVAKVNKDFKRKNKVKSDPYSATSYKKESVRRIGKRIHEQDKEDIHGTDTMEALLDLGFEPIGYRSGTDVLYKEYGKLGKRYYYVYVNISNGEVEILDKYNYDSVNVPKDLRYINTPEDANRLNNYCTDIFINTSKKESYKKLREQDVEIEVKHEGILEVPEGKNVDDLPMSHFEKLAKKKGLGKITKALNNLQVWNKKKDPKLAKWAGDMIDKLNKKLKKESMIKESGRRSYWKYNYMNLPGDNSEDRFYYYNRNSIRKIRLIPCDNPDDCYTDTTQAVCNYEYPYDEVFCTKDEAYEYLMASLNNSTYEREHDI